MKLGIEKMLHGRNPDPGGEKSRRKQKRKSPLRSEEEKENRAPDQIWQGNVEME